MSDFLPAQGINWGPGGAVGKVQYGDDANMIVTFSMRSIRCGQAEIAAGGPSHKAMTYITIREPGNRPLHVVDRPATDLDKAKWPRHWAQFEAGHAQIPDGTPIEALFRPDTEPDIIDRLHQAGIYVIPQVANMSEHTMDRIGIGARQWKARAEAFVSVAGNDAQVVAMKERMEAMEREMTELREAALASAKKSRKVAEAVDD